MSKKFAPIRMLTKRQRDKEREGDLFSEKVGSNTQKSNFSTQGGKSKEKNNLLLQRDQNKDNIEFRDQLGQQSISQDILSTFPLLYR